MSHLRAALALVALIALSFPTFVTAQTVEPTETQSRYNNEGVLKMQDSDYEGAVARFQSSLALGDLNITYLNLGRSYFRLDRCLEAQEAYDRVESSPAVASPTPAEIAAALTKFRADLAEACTGRVVFVCDEPSKVAIDESKPRRCDGELVWPVTPGQHVALRTDASAKETVNVKDGEEVRVTLVPAVATTPSGDGDSSGGGSDVTKTAPPAESEMSGKDIFGWFAVGSGAVMLTTAVLVDQTVVAGSLEDVEKAAAANDPAAYQEAVDSLESQQTLNTIVIGTGAALTVVGVALLLWPEPEDAQSVELTPVISKDGVGVQAGFTW